MKEDLVTVKIRREVIPGLEHIVEKVKDEFGIPKFRSKADAVTEAVKEFLHKYESEVPAR